MQLTKERPKNGVADLAQIRHLVQADFAAVDSMILAELASDVPLVNDIVLHIVNSGGKRLRPLLLLLMTHALGYGGDQEHHELAVIIEFIHTATLLHDDVVDDSAQRRNQPTANAEWGNAASVLAGDFLYSRAFQILARRSNIPVMALLASTTNQIAEGEMLQLMNVGNCALNEADYYKVIQRKTAELYSAACGIGAMLAVRGDAHTCQLAKQIGLHFGLAFQLIDDLLDYTADSQQMGKNLGDDLAEGKVTLPLLYALQQGNAAQKQLIEQAIQSAGRKRIAEVLEIIAITGGCDYTLHAATQEVQRGQHLLQALPDNDYRAGIFQLSEFVLARGY